MKEPITNRYTMSIPGICNYIGDISQVPNLFRNHSMLTRLFNKLSESMLPTVKRNDFSDFVTQYLLKGITA